MDNSSNARRILPRKKEATDTKRGISQASSSATGGEDISKPPRPGLRSAHSSTSPADTRPSPPVLGQPFTLDKIVLTPGGASEASQARDPSFTNPRSSYAALSTSLIATSRLEAISYSSSSITSSRRREKSPVKNPSDLLFAEHPLSFDPPKSLKLPAPLKELDSRLKTVKAGVNLVPQGIDVSSFSYISS